MKDLECPYCGESLDVCHDYGYGYSEDEKHQMNCDYCGKEFVFMTSISFYYNPERADCLNDGNHDFNLTSTHPKEFSKMSVQCVEKKER